MFRRLTIAIVLCLLAMSMWLNVSIATAATAISTPVPVVRVAVTKTILPGVVRISRLRVREGASIRTRTIFTLLRNVHVTVLGLSTNRHWLKIQTGDGKIGWVSAAYIKLVGGRFRNLPTVQ